MSEKKRLVIIDGYSLLYRAFFATRYLSTSDGRPTNALYGFTSMLFSLLEQVRPQAIVVALDAPGKTFRHHDYDAYKGTRKETAVELKVQLVAARELIAALGIQSVEVLGFEADDVVGTISRLAEENGYHTTIITGDLDCLQLVDDFVNVMTMRQGVTDTITYDPAAVEARYGFGPKFVPDFKALKGDASDNIPGVPGIGDKGAAELINAFGEVENLITRFDEIEPKYKKKLDGNLDQMMLCKKLATIVRDVPLEYDFRAFNLTQAQLDAAKSFLEGYELKSAARKVDTVLGPYAGVGKFSDGPTVEVLKESLRAELKSVASFKELRELIADQPYALAFSAVPGASLFDENRKATVAIGTAAYDVSEEWGLDILRANAGHAVMHDAKPLYRTLEKGIPAPGFDSAIAGYVLQSGRSVYALPDLVQGYLEVQPPTSTPDMTVAMLQLREAMLARLEKEGQTNVLNQIELPLIPILADMERIGIRVDRAQLEDFSKSLGVTIEQTTATIIQLAGQEFNIGSPKQLGEILFEKLQIPGGQKTKTGYATGAEILSVLAPQHEIAQEVMNWRELSKLKSTYADALGKMIASDGRIHTTYNQTVAATGRLSSNDPNLQNIPIRTELGRGIRKAFIAAEGHELASFDYSQIELRVLAHMCEEKALVEAFQSHQDVHTATAKVMFHLTDVEPTKEQRRLAKMLNYAVLYGVTDFGLAAQLGGGFSRTEAKQLITTYNERFPTVKEFTRSVVTEAKSKGFTTTLNGRRRYFPDIHAAKVQERQYAERQAMNAPIQGTAADMLKLAMIKAYATIKGTSTRMLLNVHDELVFEIPTSARELVEPLKFDMEEAVKLNVPIEVDAKIGFNWSEMTPVK